MKLLGWSIIAASCCGVVVRDTQPPPATGEQNVECAGAMLRSMLWRSENIWAAHGVSVRRYQRARSGYCKDILCQPSNLGASKSDYPVFFLNVHAASFPWKRLKIGQIVEIGALAIVLLLELGSSRRSLSAACMAAFDIPAETWR